MMANTTGEKEDESLGLFQLWPDPDSSIETKIDIVAIHGLGGHPFKTWAAGDRMWLKDFLPKEIPEARIFTYGYNSGVAFNKSASDISDFSRDLLERLLATRRRVLANRPVIFVCHSLGGIVLKKALIIAHERSRYESILKSVKGIIFMGTPHRGADIAYWSGLLGKIANIPLLGSLKTDVLKDLEPKSRTLGDISSQFVERGRSFQIFSLYERVMMAGINSLVVDKDSAILHLPNEIPLPVEADHQDICRFYTASNQRFLALLSNLYELVDNTDADETTRVCT